MTTAHRLYRAAGFLTAVALAASATMVSAQLQPAPQASGTLVEVEAVEPAQGRLLAKDGRIFLVTDGSVLESGLRDDMQGPGILEVLQPGMAVRIVVEADTDPPLVKRMKVETR